MGRGGKAEGSGVEGGLVVERDGPKEQREREGEGEAEKQRG